MCALARQQGHHCCGVTTAVLSTCAYMHGFEARQVFIITTSINLFLRLVAAGSCTDPFLGGAWQLQVRAEGEALPHEPIPF